MRKKDIENGEFFVQRQLWEVRTTICKDPKMSLAAKLDIGVRLLAFAILGGVAVASAIPW